MSKHSLPNPAQAPSTKTVAAPAPARIALPPEPKSVFVLWLLAALLTWWSFGFTTMMGSDLWWHLASGRWLWHAHTLNFTDPWSYTRHGQPWLSHEWFSDLIFHAWSSLFGMATLVWWKWTVLVSAFLLMFAVLRQISGSSLASYLATLFAMAVGAPFFDIRPQLYSLVGFALVLRLALLPSRLRWLLPVVFFFWVNLHGGFFFGLLVLTAVLAVARLVGEAKRNDLPLWLACLAVCLVSPSGPDAYVFSLHYALHPRSPYLRVGEWKPLWEPGGIRCALYYPAIATFFLSSAAAFLARLHRKHARLTYTALALGLLTLAMSLKSRRFIPLFGMAQSLLLAPALGQLLSRVGQPILRRLPHVQHSLRWRLVPPVLALGLGAALLAPYPLSSRAFLYLTSQDSFPVEALNVAEANQLTGKVFAYYEWGGYVDLRTNGRLQVYIDGRADTVFDDQIYRSYTRVLGLARGWEDLVEASGADYFLWPKRQRRQIDALRASGKWRTLYSDHVAAWLVRSDRVPQGPLLPSPESAWREFTLGWAASGTKDLAAAEVHLQRALQLMPNLRMACEWLANVQARSNRLADAEATLERCQQSFPDHERRRELLAIFRSRAQIPQEASP